MTTEHYERSTSAENSELIQIRNVVEEKQFFFLFCFLLTKSESKTKCQALWTDVENLGQTQDLG